MKLWWNVLEKQVNYIEHNYIDEMKKYIDEIVPGMKLREAWNSPFHWKPLGKQWNGQHSISLKSISKTMKWTTRRLPQFHSWDNYIDEISSMKFHRWNEWSNAGMKFHRKPLVKQWNGPCSISSKTTRKTMKWNGSWCSERAHFIHAEHNYIDENYIDEITSMKWMMKSGDEISLKTVSKTMKWAILNFIKNR